MVVSAKLPRRELGLHPRRPLSILRVLQVHRALVELQVPVHCELGHACDGALTQFHHAGGREVGRAGWRRKYWVCWEGICRGMGQAVDRGERGWNPIRFGTYNIRNGQNGGLESVLRGVGQENVDVGVFQDTKLTEGIYTRKSDRYKVVATPAPI